MPLAQIHGSELQPIFTGRLDILSAEIAKGVSSDFTRHIEGLKQSHPEQIDEILVHLEALVYDGSDSDWINDIYFGEWALKLWDATWEQLHTFSLEKNRENNHTLRRAGDTIQQRDAIIYRQNTEIVRLKMQRTILAIIAAASIGAYAVEKIIDSRREKPVQIHVEPVSPYTHL